MAWPNPNEYMEAIQHPRQSFADPVLREAKVVTNRFGLPRPISGNFATVFEVETANGRSAVRCFLREVTNQQERYAAISAHLKQHPLPFMVNFEYLPEGIRVRGRWYPILKMDWAAGVRLDTYIEAHLDDPLRLRHLGENWIAVCRALQAAQIAHGDLQHGNILITDDDAIHLLDYDDMIVPDVLGLANREIGHRHYQHPSRRTEQTITAENFSRIDNFSSHVIGLSLFSLAVDPSLWHTTKAGDENLLFRDSDYQAPETSATLQLLAQHTDSRLRQVGQMMQAAIRSPSYLDVPPLTRSPLENRLSQSKTWLAQQLLDRLPAPLPPPPPASAVPADSWLFDHVSPETLPPLDFPEPFIDAQRQQIEQEFARSFLSRAPALAPVFLVTMMMYRFPAYPLVQEKAQQQAVIHQIEQQMLDAKAERAALSRAIVDADRRYQQEQRELELKLARLSGDLQYVRTREARELAQIERILDEQTRELLPPADVPTHLPELSDDGNASDTQAADTRLSLAEETSARDDTSSATMPQGEPDWDALMQRRSQLQVFVTANGTLPPSLDDLRAVRNRYAEAQRTLEQQQHDDARRLALIRDHSESLAQANTLRQQISEVEARLALLRRQHAQAIAEQRRYERITRAMLLWKILRSLLAGSLQDTR